MAYLKAYSLFHDFMYKILRTGVNSSSQSMSCGHNYPVCRRKQ